MDKVGLVSLMPLQEDYDVELVMQFLVVMFFLTYEAITLTRMSRSQKRYAPLAMFALLLRTNYFEENTYLCPVVDNESINLLPDVARVLWTPELSSQSIHSRTCQI